MSRIGFISSFQLMGDIGSEIAQKTKGMEVGWSYPSFFNEFYYNASPLLLYDNFAIDKWGAEVLVENYRSINEELSKNLKDFFSSNIVKKFDTESLLKETDISETKRHYDNLLKDKNFERDVKSIETLKGHSYANPSPIMFESMNLPVLSLLSMRLKSKYNQPVSIIDESCRIPLFLRKSSYDLRDFLKEKITSETINLLRSSPNDAVLALPKCTLSNVDEFLALWKDKDIAKFRRKINEIATKIDLISIETETPIKDIISSRTIILKEIRAEVKKTLEEKDLFKRLPLRIVPHAITILGTVSALTTNIWGKAGTIISGLSTISYLEYQRTYEKKVGSWLEYSKKLSS